MAAQKIRPVKGERNVLITSALPYVNNVPHLGNLIGSVLSADVFSRYNKRRGYNTLYICGTDEYGTATETKALDENVTPKELVDKFHVVHKDVYDWFEIEFDHFGRTTSDKHTEIVQDMFLKIWKNGYFEERTTQQPYCETHGGFLADRFVEGTCPICGYEDARGDQCDDCTNVLDPIQLKNPRCKTCTKDKNNPPPAPVWRDTKHIFLLLDKLQPKIEEWFKKSVEEGKWSPNGVAIAKSWFEKGLHARSITRDLKWGIQIPLDDPEYATKVIYVWFDACIGYPSITACYDPEEWEKWWKAPEDVKLFQFMGKDNTPFHACTFPACEIASGENWTMVNNISTTEYLNYEGGKFSKSRKIGVFGDQARETNIPADVWRYTLLSARPESGDTQFEWSSLQSANNSILLNNLGNFINRIVKFVDAKFDGVVPEFSADYTDDTFDFAQWRSEVDAVVKEYIDDMEGVHLRSGLSKAIAISAKGNDLVQYRLDNASLEAHPQRTHAVIGLGLNLCGLVAAIISPFIPATSKSIAEQLNVELPLIPDSFGTNIVSAGHKIGKAAHLFRPIDKKTIDKWQEEFGGTSEEKQKEAAAKKKKQEDKDRKKAKKAAQKAKEAAEAAGSAEQKTIVDSVKEVATKVGEAAVQAKDAVIAAVTGEANTGAAAAPARVDPHTVATDEIKELPIRAKPVEK